MGDPVFEALCDIFEDNLDAREFEKLLAEYGFMIVPIEDPTNLRYGADDE